MADNDPTPTPTPDPKPDPTPDPTPRSFSQDEVDRIVQDRVARVKATPPDDYADLQAKAKKLAEIEAANATELEKAQQRADEADKAREAALAEAREIRVRAAIIAEAAKPDRKIADIEAAYGFLTGIDKDLLEVDDKGNPADIAKALDSLLEKRPILVAAQGGARPNGADQGARSGGTENQISRDQLKDMSPEAVRDALKEGKLDTALKGG